MSSSDNSNDDFLGKYTCSEMLSRLEFMRLQPKVIAVLGFVLDYCAEKLSEKFPEANIITSFEEKNVDVDLIFANLFLPWVDLPKTIRDWRERMSVEGLAMFSAFGPDTLQELQEQTLLPQLIDMHDLGDAFVRAHFADPVLDAETLTVTYKNDKQLIRELQVNRLIQEDNLKVPLTPDEKGLYALTFEMIFGHAWRGSGDYMADEQGTVKIPLAHLRKRNVN